MLETYLRAKECPTFYTNKYSFANVGNSDTMAAVSATSRRTTVRWSGTPTLASMSRGEALDNIVQPSFLCKLDFRSCNVSLTSSTQNRLAQTVDTSGFDLRCQVGAIYCTDI